MLPHCLAPHDAVKTFLTLVDDAGLAGNPLGDCRRSFGVLSRLQKPISKLENNVGEWFIRRVVFVVWYALAFTFHYFPISSVIGRSLLILGETVKKPF